MLDLDHVHALGTPRLYATVPADHLWSAWLPQHLGGNEVQMLGQNKWGSCAGPRHFLGCMRHEPAGHMLIRLAPATPRGLVRRCSAGSLTVWSLAMLGGGPRGTT